MVVGAAGHVSTCLSADSACTDIKVRAVGERTEDFRLCQAILLVLFPGHFLQDSPVTVHFTVSCKRDDLFSKGGQSACTTCLASAEGSAADALFETVMLGEAVMFALIVSDSLHVKDGRRS